MAEIKLTPKQKAFCDEYLKCRNATEAAIAAGYSKRSAKEIASENLSKPHLRAYMDKRMESLESDTIATQREVLEYFTAVMRGKSVAEEIVVEGCGDGYSEARTMKKAPSEKDRLMAAEKLARCHGLFVDREKMKMDRERLELEKERLDMEKAKTEALKPDKEIKVIIEGYEEDWSE